MRTLRSKKRKLLTFVQGTMLLLSLMLITLLSQGRGNDPLENLPSLASHWTLLVTRNTAQDLPPLNSATVQKLNMGIPWTYYSDAILPLVNDNSRYVECSPLAVVVDNNDLVVVGTDHLFMQDFLGRSDHDNVFSSDSGVNVIIGHNLAKRIKVQIGDSIYLSNATFEIDGTVNLVLDRQQSAVDHLVFVPIEKILGDQGEPSTPEMIEISLRTFLDSDNITDDFLPFISPKTSGGLMSGFVVRERNNGINYLIALQEMITRDVSCIPRYPGAGR